VVLRPGVIPQPLRGADCGLAVHISPLAEACLSQCDAFSESHPDELTLLVLCVPTADLPNERMQSLASAMVRPFDFCVIACPDPHVRQADKFWKTDGGIPPRKLLAAPPLPPDTDFDHSTAADGTPTPTSLALLKSRVENEGLAGYAVPSDHWARACLELHPPTAYWLDSAAVADARLYRRQPARWAELPRGGVVVAGA
jgi:hypothetical protein